MLQLSRDDLIRAYTQMRTIRVFEDRVHDEFAAGKIPGFVRICEVRMSDNVWLMAKGSRRPVLVTSDGENPPPSTAARSSNADL